MKLIMEDALLLDGSIEETLNEGTGITERNYFISGIFSTPNTKNRNGRVYSGNIWEREVQKYQKEINEKSVNTLGEWQHPPRSTVDPSKAVMRIVELKMDAVGNVIGKAKILNDNTELTNKIKGLIKEGIKIGVSSRGVGKVSATGVVEDFNLITYDAVDQPSDYNAMLNGVVEGVQFINGIAQDKEYEINENGCIGETCKMNENFTSNNSLKEEDLEALGFKKISDKRGSAIYKDKNGNSITVRMNKNDVTSSFRFKDNELETELKKKVGGDITNEISDYLENVYSEELSNYLIEFREKLKEEIYSDISDYLNDAVTEIKQDQRNIVEGVSEFLSERTSSKDIKTADKILESFKIQENSGKCFKCLINVPTENGICEECNNEVSESSKPKEDYFTTIKNRVFS